MNTRVAYCHLIAQVLAADGMITPNERAFLGRVMERMGLSDAERDQVIHFEDAAAAAATARSMPEVERRALLDELVAAALVDGKLSPFETKAVRELTEALGFADVGRTPS